MDFGFTNDPTTLVRIVLHEGKLYGELLLYQTGMTGGDIVKFLDSIRFPKDKHIYCDNAPATIEDMRRGGYKKARAAKKWKGCVSERIGQLNSYGYLQLVHNIHWKAEQIGYKYKENKLTGQPTNDPDDTLGLGHIWDGMGLSLIHISEPTRPY